MNQMSPEEEQKILRSHPKGTYALMIAFALVLLGAWLLMYFGRYLVLGPAS